MLLFYSSLGRFAGDVKGIPQIGEAGGVALALAICAISCLSPAVLGTGQIRILAIGQVMPGESPIPLWFDADPLVDYVLVPTEADFQQDLSLDGWRRLVRMYFPRSREVLVEGFHFFVFPDGDLTPFTPSQIADMRYAMEKGLGSFVTMGGGLASPYARHYYSWANSVLSEILPVELNEEMRQNLDVFSIRVVKDDPPVLSMFVPLGIEAVRGSFALTTLSTRVGATLWAIYRVVVSQGGWGVSLGVGEERDWLVSWRVGPTGGMFWVVADDLDSTWWSPIWSGKIWCAGEFENEYAGDVFANILFHSTGVPLPQDVFQLHRLRRLYFDYNVERSLLIGLLDFVDTFGANTRGVYARIDEIDRLRLASFERYRAYEFAHAAEIMGSAMSDFAGLMQDAMDLKDKALLWVYLTQWVAVSGTSLICGFLLWTLMVRRRLYREVVTTRLGLRQPSS